MKTTLYLAYGSNLNKRQMANRCPDAVSMGRVQIPGWTLRFSGVATIVPIEDKMLGPLEAGLWKITERCEEALDKYEGYPWLYHKQTINGFMTYIKNDAKAFPPMGGYFSAIEQGYKDFGLDESYLYAVLGDAYHDYEPDEYQGNIVLGDVDA
jgi:hypothetical protein